MIMLLLVLDALLLKPWVNTVRCTLYKGPLGTDLACKPWPPRMKLCLHLDLKLFHRTSVSVPHSSLPQDFLQLCQSSPHTSFIMADRYSFSLTTFSPR